MRPTRFVVLIIGVCCVLTGCFRAYFGTEMPESLREHGVVANATILRIWDTGWTVNNDPVVGMRLAVRPPDRAAFESTINRYIVPRLEVPQFQPGKTIRVRFDPDDLKSVAVDRQTEAGSQSGQESQ